MVLNFSLSHLLPFHLHFRVGGRASAYAANVKVPAYAVSVFVALCRAGVEFLLVAALERVWEGCGAGFWVVGVGDVEGLACSELLGWEPSSR